MQIYKCKINNMYLCSQHCPRSSDSAVCRPILKKWYHLKCTLKQSEWHLLLRWLLGMHRKRRKEWFYIELSGKFVIVSLKSQLKLPEWLYIHESRCNNGILKTRWIFGDFLKVIMSNWKASHFALATRRYSHFNPIGNILCNESADSNKKAWVCRFRTKESLIRKIARKEILSHLFVRAIHLKV